MTPAIVLLALAVAAVAIFAVVRARASAARRVTAANGTGDATSREAVDETTSGMRDPMFMTVKGARQPAPSEDADEAQPVTRNETALPVSDVTGEADGEPGVAEPSTAWPAVAWPALVTDDDTQLDAAARIRLLADLGIVRAPWCVPVVVRAFEEERDPSVRHAALAALGGFRHSSDARAALERAAHGDDADERSLAQTALRAFAPATNGRRV